MRILFLSTWFPYPPDNGSKLRIYHLLRALAQTHQVTLISFAFDTARADEANELDAWCQDIRVVPINPFAYNRAGVLRTFLSPRPMASRPIPIMNHLVADVSQGNPFDAVIASTEMMANYALLAGPGTKKVLEEHNSMARWAREWYEGARGWVQRGRRWASWQKDRRHEARIFPRFDLITMVSEADRQATIDAVGAGRVRVEVVPNGVDCDHNRPGLGQPQPDSLVYNGSLTYSANYDAMRWFLAEVYLRIKAQRPDVTLTITGSTHSVDLTGLALVDTVRLTGFVEDVRLPVARAAVCVAPIRQGGGTRLKILEAMALGTSVVATSKAAEGLDVIDGEHLLLADDPETFTLRTVELLGNPDLRQRLTANARRLVGEHYDWQGIGAHFVDLIEEIVRKRSGKPVRRAPHDHSTS